MNFFNKKTRLFSQILFFVLFCFLVIKSEFSGITKSIENIQLPYPISLFLEIDPLITISTLLSSYTVYKNLIFSLIVILITICFGRFFCGWVCPLGTLNHLISSFNFGKLKGKGRIDTNSYKPWQKIKYYILFFFLSSALFTTVQIGLLDPICLITRSFGLVVIPSLSYSFYAFAQHLNSTDITFFQKLGEISLYIGQRTVIPYKAIHFDSIFLISLIFITIIFSNRFITRFWCRLLCPLGALLGVLSRFSFYGLEKNEKLCTNCNRCELYCQGGDNPIPGEKWHKTECHLCFNCISECPEKALQFKILPKIETTIETPDLTKRKVISSLALGIISVPLLRSQAGLEVNYSPKLIRPPGSLEEKDFLSKCVKCGACMKVCPNNALHPTLSEANFEGLWSPTLIPRIGYCEPSCTLCSTVCPTGAINEISSNEKGWVNTKNDNEKKNPIKIGLAFIDKGRCLPWAMNTPCIVCEEWCPTSPKSIYLEEIDGFKRNGEIVHLKRPIVDPILCVGCGACEFACPLEEKPAIYITNIGESRSKTNQILLKEGV